VKIQGMEMLTLIVGLYCAGFVSLTDVVAGIRRQGIALLVGSNGIGFHLKAETDSTLRNVVF
jgi:hypothetical protein